ncbi:MAG: hypothetical protein QM529_03080 [Hydrotalea sp.]|nr:hypothetical protein [Hydrotalea sp.]
MKFYKKTILIIVLILGLGLTAVNGFKLYQKIVFGERVNGTYEKLYPYFNGWDTWLGTSDRPEYKENVKEALAYCGVLSSDCFGVVNKFGLDFGISTFFPAHWQKLDGKFYSPTHGSSANSTYTTTPLAILLFNYVGLSKLEYTHAYLAFMAIQYFLFLGAIIYYFGRKNLSLFKIITAMLVVSFILLVSPPGIWFFEKGQRYLFNATAILLVLKGWRDNKAFDLLLASMLAALHLSFLPPLFLLLVALSLFAFLPYISPSAMLTTSTFGNNIKKYLFDYRKRIVFGLCVGLLPMLLLFIAPIDEVKTYAGWIRQQESGQAVNFTLTRNLGWFGYYVIPLLVIFLYWWVALLFQRQPQKRSIIFQASTEPFFLFALAYIGCQWGYKVFEYNLVQLVFLIPFLVDRRTVLFPQNKLAIKKFSYSPRIIALLILGIIFIFRLNEFFGPWGHFFNTLHTYLPAALMMLLPAIWIIKLSFSDKK